MNAKKRYHVSLFQPYLRKHILNFGKYLTSFTFVVQKPSSGNFYHTQLPSSFKGEIERTKTNWVNTLRRILGVSNVRIQFNKDADIFFTYGSLLITNKPYCIYIENGTALYNYDVKLARHPLAKLIVSFLIRKKNCKALIFMSIASQKSFLVAAQYSPETLSSIKNKSIQIYPLVESKNVEPKRSSSTLRLLFSGMFYMKGGLELAHAYVSLREKYKNLELTIVTPLQTMKHSDLAYIRNLEGVTVLDAKLDAAQMGKLFLNHDIFLLPTYRDSFGLVLIEAISYGMPIICTDQFATTEVAIHGYNAFVYPKHPLKDYDPNTFQMLGKYRNPRAFYADLFALQEKNALHPIETFLYTSIEKFLIDPNLLEKFSVHSLELYNSTFHQDIISQKIEHVFSKAIQQETLRADGVSPGLIQ